MTLEDVKTVAMRVEASVRDRKKPNVVEINEIDEEEEEEEEGREVDAIHRNSQRMLRQYERQGRGSGNRNFRGGRGGRGGQQPRFNGLCHYCRRPGHLIRNCFARQAAEKAGNNQNKSPNDKPRENAEIDTSVEVNALDASEYLNMYQT